MKMSLPLSRYIAFAIVSSVAVFSVNVYAGAFQLWEQDAGGTGDYHAGGAAEANTAATEFFNPAGMTQIKHQQVSFGSALVSVAVNFTGTETTPLELPPLPVFDVTQPVNNAAGDTVDFVPNMHYVYPLSNRWALGFGVTTPFGLETRYDDAFPVNNLATKTELATVNLNPSVAYKVNRYLSLGVGFDELYGQAVYDSAEQPYSAMQASEIRSKLSGWEPGYNAGLLITATPTTRVGLSYRSEMKISADGSSGSQLLLTGQAITNNHTSAVFPLPATTILSVYHDVNSRFSVMASAFYTQWSVFRELVIQNLTTPASQNTTLALNEDYRNTWNLAIGGKYKITQHIALAAGFGHDDTPTRLGMRDIRLPDNNRYATSLGVDIQPSPGFLWSMGWTHFFVPTTAIDNSNANNGTQTTPINALPAIGVGNAKGDINVIGMQLTCNI